MLSNPDLHHMAHGHVPGYLPGADGSDPLFTVMAVFTIVLIMGIGALYFTLHALPEKMAHTDNHMQFQLIGILSVMALFTHNNLFWVAAIVIAAFRMPDFLTPIQSIAGSLKRLEPNEIGPEEVPVPTVSEKVSSPDPAKPQAEEG
nr:hypothetical protein [Pseudophaeobacter sp. EL27]